MARPQRGEMSSRKYSPPYKVSGKAMNLIAEIAAAIERYRIILEGPDGVRLRKINHIRTLRGTTAIEGNTLTEAQITDILAGKRIAGPQREIDEVKGAHAAYEAIESFNPYSVDNLLKAHGLMTKGLVSRPGKFRNCNVGRSLISCSTRFFGHSRPRVRRMGLPARRVARKVARKSCQS